MGVFVHPASCSGQSEGIRLKLVGVFTLYAGLKIKTQKSIAFVYMKPSTRLSCSVSTKIKAGEGAREGSEAGVIQKMVRKRQEGGNKETHLEKLGSIQKDTFRK